MKIRLLLVLTMLLAFFTLTGFKNVEEASSGIIYEDNKANAYIIGDSRVFNMRLSISREKAKDFNWLTICASGYQNLVSDIVPILNQENLSGKTIIIESGLNDILIYDGPDKTYMNYCNFYSTTAQEWIKRGATVKMVRVLPIMSVNGSNEDRNGVIIKYDNDLQAALPGNIGAIDLNVVPLGFSDELHFNDATSIGLYNVLRQFK